MTKELENKIGYTFSNKVFLEKALTHASCQEKEFSNERLEFLGDRVLGVVIAEWLFLEFLDEDEGCLAKRYTALVQKKALVSVAEEINLSHFLKMASGEEKTGGKKKAAVIADGVEALIGAIYVDGGFRSAQTFVKKFWQKELSMQTLPPEDPKTKLQEWAQAKSFPLPEYTIISRTGSDHNPQFEIDVFVKGFEKTIGIASNKRDAEKIAAEKMLEQIGVKL